MKEKIDFTVSWDQNGREGKEALRGKAASWYSLPCISWFSEKLKMTREVGLKQDPIEISKLLRLKLYNKQIQAQLSSIHRPWKV